MTVTQLLKYFKDSKDFEIIVQKDIYLYEPEQKTIKKNGVVFVTLHKDDVEVHTKAIMPFDKVLLEALSKFYGFPDE
jgi:hypothetical protein